MLKLEEGKKRNREKERETKSGGRNREGEGWGRGRGREIVTQCYIQNKNSYSMQYHMTSVVEHVGFSLSLALIRSFQEL